MKTVRLNLQNKLIENITQYPCLGLTISASGKFGHGIQKMNGQSKGLLYEILQGNLRRILLIHTVTT